MCVPTMSSTACEQQPAVEYQAYELTVYSDGTVHRAPFGAAAVVPPCPSPSDPSQVASKDLPLNASLGTSLRLYLPPRATSCSTPSLKLPILLYFHGGSFCHFSTTVREIHNYLCRLATHVNAVIVSVDYRLAPEHPFPAAYEDCFEALLWLDQQAGPSGEPWLADHGDFSRCFLIGDSAGATTVHYVGMQAVGHGSWESRHRDKALQHVSLQGMILCHPYFSCGEEVEVSPGRKDNLFLKYWKVTTEHPLLNPIGTAAPSVARAPLPRMLVCVAGADPISGGGILYHESLVAAGKDAKISVAENEPHVFHLMVPDSPHVLPLLDAVRDLINAQ